MNFSVRGYIGITRPLNIFIGVLAIFMGAFITGTIQPLQNLVLACLSGALIMAGGNVINDYFDVDIDRMNKPFRPIPSNIVNREDAYKFAIILFVLGNFLSIFIIWTSFSLAVFASAGLFLYSWSLKRTILWGNIAVSLFSALAFVYGGLSVGRWQNALIPAGFAFLFHLGREIIKDVEDQAADEANSLKTLPIRFGSKVALLVASGVLGFLIVLTIVPYVLNIYGRTYFTVVLLGVDLVIIVILYLMWVYPYPQYLRRISLVLKADMFVGLLAIYLGTSK